MLLPQGLYVKKILSHTFNFQTPDSSKEQDFLENIISITEEEDHKQYVQYIQYWTQSASKKTTVYSRELNIKVDRTYYLEIANINIDDRARRRYFFSVLGRRRFGANNKNVDYYLLDEKLDFNKLNETFEKENKEVDTTYSHVEISTISTNSFRLLDMKVDDKNIIYLEQLNNKKRKKIKKSYFVELEEDDFQFYKKINFEQKKVNYIFNKIGKIYFKSLTVNSSVIDEKKESVEEFIKSKLQKNNFEMDMTARINNNSAFRILKDKPQKIEDIYLNLYSTSHLIMKKHDDEKSIYMFSMAVIEFARETKDIKEFDEITTYLTTMQMLAESGTLSYLFLQYDPDFRDIFLYMLESLTLWNSYLVSSTEDVRAFNIATIDLHDALRHLVDMSFAFKHDYQLKEIEKEKKQEINPLKKTNSATVPHITSAQEYFKEVELDLEAYDELAELEVDVGELPYLDKLDNEISEKLIKFFHGYTHILNPLFEFKDLSYSLMVLSQKLEELEFEKDDGMLLVLVQGLVNDLLLWTKSVIIEKTAEDIHYMNKSFYSNISQIEILMEGETGEYTDEDDIFF